MDPPATSSPLRRRAMAALLLALAGAAAAFLWLVPPIAQDPAYHDFADQRRLLGISHFWNVISNAPFVLVGALGLAFLRSPAARPPGAAFLTVAELRLFALFFLGVAATGVGSTYYHWRPGDGTLFWDRLPMTVVFMSLLGILIAERFRVRLGAALTPPLLLAGAGSVLYWLLSEQAGQGDLRPYFLVQALPLLAAALLLLRAPRYTRGGDYLVALALYALALACDRGDAVVYGWGGLARTNLLGGHALKHLLAALGAYWLLRMVWNRRAAA